MARRADSLDPSLDVLFIILLDLRCPWIDTVSNSASNKLQVVRPSNANDSIVGVSVAALSSRLYSSFRFKSSSNQKDNVCRYYLEQSSFTLLTSYILGL